MVKFMYIVHGTEFLCSVMSLLASFDIFLPGFHSHRGHFSAHFWYNRLVYEFLAANVLNPNKRRRNEGPSGHPGVTMLIGLKFVPCSLYGLATTESL